MMRRARKVPRSGGKPDQLVRGEKGSALIATLLISSLLLLFCFAFITESNTATSFSLKQEAKTNAFYAAEAGAQRAYAKLCEDFEWRQGFQATRIGTAQYTVKVDDWLSDYGLKMRTLRITSTGSARGVQKTVRMLVSPVSEEAFAHACFAAEEMRLGAGTWPGPEVHGPIHSTGRFEMGPWCTVYGDLTAQGDAAVGTLGAVGQPSRFYGDVESGGDVYIALACSILARDSDSIVCVSLPTANGDVKARQSIDCEGYIEGERRSLSHNGVDTLVFPEQFFDIGWPSSEKSSIRGWPIYLFDSPHKFNDFLEQNYSRKHETYLLNGIFFIKNDLDFKTPMPAKRVIIMGTLVVFGDVRIDTPTPFMIEKADSTLPAIVALGNDSKRGDITFKNTGGPVSVSGLVYAKGEIWLGDRDVNNPITVSGALCGKRIYCGGNTTVTYDPSVKLVLPFSSRPLVVQSWEEM